MYIIFSLKYPSFLPSFSLFLLPLPLLLLFLLLLLLLLSFPSCVSLTVFSSASSFLCSCHFCLDFFDFSSTSSLNFAGHIYLFLLSAVSFLSSYSLALGPSFIRNCSIILLKLMRKRLLILLCFMVTFFQ